MILISLNVLAVILETVPEIDSELGGFLRAFEAVSALLFATEYGLRLWVSDLTKSSMRPSSSRLRYIASPMAIIDLLAFLPSLLPMFIGVDLRILRVLRLVRLLRLLKLVRYVKALRVLTNVISSRSAELTVSAMIAGLVFLISSRLMYFAEHAAQPDHFSRIPHTMWWAVTTLTTVGYGDIVPITLIGRILGAIIAILGVAMFALPAGIIASGFNDAIRDSRKSNGACPTCGHEHEATNDEEMENVP